MPKKSSNSPEDETPETPETPTDALDPNKLWGQEQPAKPEEPVGVVEFEEAVSAPAPDPNAVSFFIGEIQLLTFQDGTQHHVSSHHITTSDKQLIANLDEAAKVKSNKIFRNPTY